MTFRLLEITLIGLIAFVPDVNNHRLTVLLPDVTQPYFASDGHEIPTHKPLLLYCCENVRGGCTDLDRTPKAASYLYDSLGMSLNDPFVCAKGFGARSLDGVTITISNLANKRLGPIVEGVASPPEFNVGSPTTAKVAPDLLDRNKPLPASYTELIAARMFLEDEDFSVLANVHLSASYYLEPLHLRGNPANAKPIAEASQLTCSLVPNSSSVDITLTSFRGDKTVTITLEPIGGKSVVPVYITNAATCAKWDSSNKKCVDSDSTDQNHGNDHFEVYYELANNRPPQLFRPVPKYASGLSSARPVVDESILKNPVIVNFIDRPLCPPAQLTP